MADRVRRRGVAGPAVGVLLAALLSAAPALAGCAASQPADTGQPGAEAAGGGGAGAGRGPSPGGGGSGSATVAGARLADGCGVRRPGVGTRLVTLAVDGRRRVAVVHVPPSYQGTRRVPLVLNLHPTGSTAIAQALLTGMNAVADRRGFVVAYPQAAIRAGRGFAWNVPGAVLPGGRPVPRGAADDLAYLTRLVATLQRGYCLDPSRVFAAGFSGGARMASQLGCEPNSGLAAVAAVSGLRLPTRCERTRPVAVVTFHGTADGVNPYAGGGQRYWGYSVPVGAERWAAHDRCAPRPTTSRPAAAVTLTAYADCADGTAVSLYTIAGGGHDWPGRRVGRNGARPGADLDATGLIWAFFAAHPRA